MRIRFLSTLAAGLMLAGAAAAQDNAGPTTQEVGLPLVDGMAFDDACGPRPQYQGKAVCVRGALVALTPVAETYIGHFQSQGWEVVSGHDNGVIFARKRADGGCDGMEMAAYYDETRALNTGSEGWIAFAPLPGNLCPAAAAP